jgi:hypothetical protein
MGRAGSMGRMGLLGRARRRLAAWRLDRRHRRIVGRISDAFVCPTCGAGHPAVHMIYAGWSPGQPATVWIATLSCSAEGCSTHWTKAVPPRLLIP